MTKKKVELQKGSFLLGEAEVKEDIVAHFEYAIRLRNGFQVYKPLTKPDRFVDVAVLLVTDQYWLVHKLGFTWYLSGIFPVDKLPVKLAQVAVVRPEPLPEQ